MIESQAGSPNAEGRAPPGMRLPVAILLLVCSVALLVLPILPVDETRYLGVAWEMYDSGSFVVPLQNGMPYSHKPPLLFWLIQSGWSLFGVNAVTPRLTVCALGIACLFLLRGISLRLWPGERLAASLAALILASMIIWMIWSSAIMFDVLMTFWVLVCVRGMLDRAQFSRKRGWWMLALGVAGGILTKGPVIFVYSLPLVFVLSLVTGQKWRMPWALLGAAVSGLVLSLAWVIPAVLQGGESYKHALLWSQTVDRVGESFSHQRPFWWYLPVLPALMLPWLLYMPALRGATRKNACGGTKFALVWIVIPFIVFSAISCKQVQYLIPILPAVALLMGRNVARSEEGKGLASARVIGALFMLIGIAGMIVPYTLGLVEPARGWDDWPLIGAGVVSIVAGILLIKPGSTAAARAQRLALSSALLVASIVFGVGRSLMDGYNLEGISQAIHQHMSEGRPVAHSGKYHGQYHFLGRLSAPLEILQGGSDPKWALEFLKKHPGGLVISNLNRKDRLPDKAVVAYQQRFRMKQTIVLWGTDPSLSKPSISTP